MLQDVNIIFDKIDADGSRENWAKLINQFFADSLIIVKINGTIDFAGDISERDKIEIQNALETESFYKVGNDVYRLALRDKIFIFRIFNDDTISSYTGFLLAKNEDSRLTLMKKQMNTMLSSLSSGG